jgi:hypothetical protein
LNQRQLQRMVVIENAVAGRVSVGEAGEALGRSARQVKRLKQVFDRSDPSWVLHGNLQQGSYAQEHIQDSQFKGSQFLRV